MNLPNKLTLGRIILVPFFVAALLIPFFLHTIVALVLFIAASITDMLDGRIARKRNLITDFGKFADPLADKILVLAALLCFVQNGWCDCIAVIIVLFREFTVTSIRLIAAAKGEVIAANIWGKVKTVTQMVAIKPSRRWSRLSRYLFSARLMISSFRFCRSSRIPSQQESISGYFSEERL